MAGGTWIDQNKVIPGVYINYSSVPATLASMGERGVVCFAHILSWGKSGEPIIINDPKECFNKLGYDQLDSKIGWLRQMLIGTNRSSGASKVIVWRLGTTGEEQATAQSSNPIPSVKASLTIGNLTCTAVDGGANGNKLSVGIAQNDGHFDVTVKNDGVAVTGGTFTGVDNVSDLTTITGVMTFSGSGALSATPQGSQINLSGGKNAEMNKLIATAKYPGVRGNDISVVVTPDPGNPDSARQIYYVQTLVGEELVDTQTIQYDDDFCPLSLLEDNDWVTFTKEGNAFQMSLTLSGGEDGTLASTAYSKFMEAMEKESWNVLAYAGATVPGELPEVNTEVTKAALISFVKRLSNDEGRKVQACILQPNGNPDTECVINVLANLITDASGHTLTYEELVCWVAGATAGATVAQSLTYSTHPEAVSLQPNPTLTEQAEHINEGHFCFFEEYGKVKVIQDINSFTTFSPTKGKQFRKNRVIRVVFGLANDIYKLFSQYYIGAVNNDDFGRNMLKAEILDLMGRYQGASALQNVQVNDVTVSPGADSDAVVIEVYCQPIDSIEKIYINITIA